MVWVISHVSSRKTGKKEWPLDKMALQVDVLKKNKEDISAPPREGAYLNGLFMEGARWDSGTGSKLKESIYASDECQGNSIGQNGNKEHLYLSSLQDT